MKERSFYATMEAVQALRGRRAATYDAGTTGRRHVLQLQRADAADASWWRAETRNVQVRVSGGVLVVSKKGHDAGTMQLVPEYGHVSALCLAENELYVLVGFEKGSLLLWNVATEQEERRLVNVASCSICDIQTVLSLDGRTQFVVLSESGNLGMLIVSKSLFSTNITMEAVSLPFAITDKVTSITPFLEKKGLTALGKLQLCAVATAHAVYLVSLKSSKAVIDSTPRPASSQEQPVIAWRRSSDNWKPAVCIIWGSVYGFKEIQKASEAAVWKTATIEPALDDTCDAFFVDHMIVGLVGTQGAVTLFNPYTSTTVAVVTLNDYWDTLAVNQPVQAQLLGYGSNTSRICIRDNEGREFVLGVHFLPWADEIEYFLSHAMYDDALQVCLISQQDSVHEHAAINVPTLDTGIKDTCLDALLVFVDFHLLRHCNESLNVTQRVTKEAFLFCLKTKSDLFISTELYKRYQSTGLEFCFFQTAQELMLDGRLSVISNTVIQDLVAYYSDLPSDQDSVEAALLHLDYGSALLDINFLAWVCEQHGFFLVSCSIHTAYLGNHVYPLLHYSKVSVSNRYDPKQIVLLYLSNVTQGIPFPWETQKPCDRAAACASFLLHAASGSGRAFLETFMALDCSIFSFCFSMALQHAPRGHDWSTLTANLIHILESKCPLQSKIETAMLLVKEGTEKSLPVDTELQKRLLAIEFTAQIAGEDIAELTSKKEREDVMLRLLRSFPNLMDEVDMKSHAWMSMSRVYTFVTKERGDLVRLFDIYVERGMKQVFPFLDEVLGDADLAVSIQAKIRRSLVHHSDALFRLSPDKSAKLMQCYIPRELPSLLQNLSRDKDKLSLLDVFPISSCSQSIQHEYLSLKCRLDPESLFDLLFEEELQYDVEVLLVQCRKQGLRLPTAYLLERIGSYHEAWDLYKEALPDGFSGKNYDDAIQLAISYCSRISSSGKSFAEPMWRSLLELCLLQYKETPALDGVFRVVDAMKVYTPVSIIFECMSCDGLNLSLEKARPLIEQLLWNTEADLFVSKAAHRILEDSIEDATSTLSSFHQGALCANDFTCAAKCGNLLYEDEKGHIEGKVVVFSCGHTYHRSCAKNGTCPRCQDDKQ